MKLALLGRAVYRSRGKLDPRLGAHSRALLAALPWGASRPPEG